ncbi:hypothetical protein SASPL_144224 [Salvia splendens]|uniref:Uncharacterized protein n=1 Tax=Salvia splendens TaxID=180675 RepID=A0A8X8WMI6_SALSN|nr:hypothetical protein SASPL_144224 [Salvia splendens]
MERGDGYILLSIMIELHTVSLSNDDFMTNTVLNEAGMVINLCFGSEITCVDIVILLELLRVRYQTFKGVVGTTGVRWDLDDKIIVADDPTWKFIFRTNPLAGSYYYRDKPEFSRLATMFGLDDVKVETSHEVINISDTTELIVIMDSHVLNASPRGMHVASPADPNEVNSPFIDSCTRVPWKVKLQEWSLNVGV